MYEWGLLFPVSRIGETEDKQPRSVERHMKNGHRLMPLDVRIY